MLRIFYTPNCFRDTAGYLFREALKGNDNKAFSDFSGILYLAPGLLKARDVQRVFHRLVAGDSTLGRCYIPPEIMTPNELSKKIYSIKGDKKLINNSLAPVIISRLSGKGIGFSALISDLIMDLKRNYPDKDVDGIRDILTGFFMESNIPDSVSRLALDCLDVFKKYRIFMDEKGLVDEADVLGVCPEYLSSVCYETVIIDGFYDPSQSEKNLLRSVIQSSKTALVSVPYESRFERLSGGYINFLKDFEAEEIHIATSKDRHKAKLPSYCSYPDPEAEVEGIARNIKSLYVSGKLRELENVLVAFPDSRKYRHMAERVFRRYGIPFHISSGNPLSESRPFVDLSCLLNSIADKYPRLEFSQFLSSHFFKRMPESLKTWVPLISPQSGIISGRESWLDFLSEGSESVDIKSLRRSEGVNLYDDLKWVLRKLKPLEDIMASAALAEYADALKKALDDLGFLESGAGSEGSSAEFRDEKKAFDEALDLIYFLSSVHPAQSSLFEFIEIFGHIVNFSFVEEERPGVMVADFFGIAGLSPEYLYLGGLIDGSMPARQDIDYFLPDSIKKKAGLLYLDKYIDIQRFIFECIVKSSENVHLSYPLMDGEDMFLPSSSLYQFEESKENLPGIYSKEERLVRSGETPLSSFISEIETRPSLWFQSRLKVTDIDAYRQCPRKFFIEKVLMLEPLSVKEYEVEAVTIGNILHKIMEKIVFEPFESLDYLKARAVKIIDDILNEKKIDRYWKELIKDTFIEILPDIYEKEIEMRGEGYMPIESERDITGEPVKGIMLKGKIDRIDMAGDAVRIIDYKSGTAGLNCSQVMKGRENLQLFLYAAMMKSRGYRIDRVGIYSLKDINIKWCPPKKRGKGQGAKGKEKDGIDDYMAASLRFLEDTAEDLRKGDFKAEPLDDYICRRCHEYPFCPYIQQ